MTGPNESLGRSRAEIVAWVGSQILPHETVARSWLRGRGASEHQIDDIVQEAYCRLAALPSVAHIVDGRSYFFRTARNIFIEQGRRARIVRIDSVPEIDALIVLDERPSPERTYAAHEELRLVRRLIEGLPGKCREIFVLRRIHAVSQRDVAQRLGVTENVVEMQTARGLKLILAAMADMRATPAGPASRIDEQSSSRKR